jgi:hypothetical protein
MRETNGRGSLGLEEMVALPSRARVYPTAATTFAPAPVYAPATTYPGADATTPASGDGWARRVFDQIAHGGPAPDVVAGPDGDDQWEVVAPPRSSTPLGSLSQGDLVVRRGLGEGRLVSLLVLGGNVEGRQLYQSDGCIRADTLVLRAAHPGGPVVRESERASRAWEQSIAETVPSFDVGVADSRPREFLQLPAHVEDWVPNAAGSGLVLQRLSCRTLAQLELHLPGAGTEISGSPSVLWRSNAAGNLEAALDLLIFHPAPTAGAATLPPGRHPLAIICMGNHAAHDGSAEILSHTGYSGFSASPPAQATGAYLQEALAARGIISVSVSTNAANLLNLLLETRANLVVAAIRKMQQLDRETTSRYFRRIDFQRLALIGHSRGGDAVARAVRLVPTDVNVRALVQLAPTDMTGLLQGAAPTVAAVPAGGGTRDFVTAPGSVGNRVRQLIVWGSRDGDVSGMQDVRADVSVNPFRHYDRSSTQRAFQYWHGATHNRFNRLWTDGDEDRIGSCPASGAPGLSRTSVAAGLMSRANQEARTIEMVRAWLLFGLHDESAEARLFDGRTATAVATALPICGMWKFGRRLVTIDQFDDLHPDRNTMGGANVSPATGVFDEVTVANENVAGAGLNAYQLPHIDRALRFSPAPTGLASPAWRTTIPTAQRNFAPFDVLTFRVTKKYDPAVLAAGTATSPQVRVRLVGPSAAHVEAAAGRLSTLPIPRLLVPPAEVECSLRVTDLTKVHYETWEVDLAPYRAAMSIADVRFVELELLTEIGQPIFIDTLSLVARP